MGIRSTQQILLRSQRQNYFEEVGSYRFKKNMARVFNKSLEDFFGSSHATGLPRSFEDMMNFQHKMFEDFPMSKFMEHKGRLFPQSRRRTESPQHNITERTSSPRYDTAAQRTEEFVKVLNIPDSMPSNVELVVDTDNKLIITGKQEVSKQNGLYSSSDVKEFKQTVDLPKNIDYEEIRLGMDAKGHLMIRAPFLTTKSQDQASLQSSSRVNEESRRSFDSPAREQNMRDEDVSYTSENCESLNHHNGEVAIGNSNEFKKTFSLKGFEPEDIELVVNSEGKIMVLARKECVQQSGGYKSSDVREFKQYVDLPPEAIKELVTSSLDEDGILTIRAPYKGTEGPEEPACASEPEPCTSSLNAAPKKTETEHNKILEAELDQKACTSSQASHEESKQLHQNEGNPIEEATPKFVSELNILCGQTKETKEDDSENKVDQDNKNSDKDLNDKIDTPEVQNDLETQKEGSAISKHVSADKNNTETTETSEIKKPKKTKKVKMVRKIRKVKKPDPANETDTDKITTL